MDFIIGREHREEALQKLNDICELYFVVKEVIIYFEEINPEQKSDIQPINELRNAFDHLMRVVAVWLNIKEKTEPNDYIITHLDKSFGHVYRAGYDTVDFLTLTLKELIYSELSGYSVRTIQEVIPNYYSEIRPSIYELNDEVTKYRSEKDVANTDARHLIEYIRDVKKIVEYHKGITKKIPTLDELERKHRAETTNTEIKDWLKRIAIGLFILFCGYMIRDISSKFSSDSSPPVQQEISKTPNK